MTAIASNWLRVFITMQISLESFRYIAFFNLSEIEENLFILIFLWKENNLNSSLGMGL